MATTTKTAAAKEKTADTEIVIVPEVEDVSSDDAAHAKVSPVNFVRRKEMVERIALSSGVKPNLIKSVLDSVLKEIGDALSNGEALNLQPLGKISVNRRKEQANGEVMICKIRRNRPAGPAAMPDVDATE